MGQSADAMIGWGVALNDEYGETHESFWDEADQGFRDLYDLTSKDEYKNILEYETAGDLNYSHYPVIYFRCSYYTINYGHKELDNDALDCRNRPTWQDQNVMDQFLTEAGFTGDRTVRLILAASYG